ncbi:hypothetical protein OC834_005162 [Tilletia horrida]|nr:hypothetical protein OC834_005162 [Tilletia horrida]KAK0557996.1 hypothetical protein OC844_005420 [Tilletia horrida]
MATPSQSSSWRPSVLPAGPWRSPLVVGIPASLQRQASTLSGAYINAGRISNSFAGLRSSTFLLAQAAKQHRSNAEETVKSSLGLVQSLQLRIDEQLQKSSSKLLSDVSGLETRIEEELTSIKSALHEQIKDGLRGLQEHLDGSAGTQRISEALDAVQISTDKLLEDCQSNEEEYMSTLAQVVVFNSWTSAWPEALRTVQGIQRPVSVSVPPPQYAPPNQSATPGSRNGNGTGEMSGVPSPPDEATSQGQA